MGDETPNYISGDILSGDSAPTSTPGDASMEARPSDNAPDIGSDAAPAVDPSIGAQPAPAPPSAGMTPDGRPTMGADSPLASSLSTGLNAAGNTYTTASGGQQQQLPPVGVKGLAQLIVQGALWGLAGSKGATHFGSGLAGGAEGYMAGKQQQVVNAQNQQQLQFDSVKAADSHVLAMKQAQEADSSIAEHKVALTNQQQQANEWADEHGQPKPFTITSDNTADTHTQASGALQTLAAQNGGTIPQITTNNSPASADDPNHKINVYTVTPNNVQKNPTAMEKAINTVRQIQAGSAEINPITAQDIMIQGGQKVKGNATAGAQQMWQDAQQFLLGVPQVSDKPAENAAISAHLQQQLDSYTQNPKAEGSTIKLLQTQLTAFNAAAENQRAKTATSESNTTLETAPSKAQAGASEASAKTIAENTGAAGAAKTAQAANEEAAKAAAKTAADASTVAWKPKTGADEKKKAELAENIAFNANEVNNMIARRPDLVGAVSGRFTSAEQMMGNNDPDISAIGTHIHNIAMANSGVHGFRSQEGVAETEKLLLNGFKNGPDAVKGAMNANVSSVQTFIDNARPESYATHSKQGGAGTYYANLPPQGLPTGSIKMQAPGGVPHWIAPDKIESAKKLGAAQVH